jgi:hypothetical protein
MECRRFGDPLCEQAGHVVQRVDLRTVRQRVAISFGRIAVAVILVGLAIGFAFREPDPPQTA